MCRRPAVTRCAAAGLGRWSACHPVDSGNSSLATTRRSRKSLVISPPRTACRALRPCDCPAGRAESRAPASSLPPIGVLSPWAARAGPLDLPPPPHPRRKIRVRRIYTDGDGPVPKRGPPPPIGAHAIVCTIGLDFSKNREKAGPPDLAATIAPCQPSSGDDMRSLSWAGPW
jgi:hypothetical protein